jgi:hypothetical protein
MSVVLNLNLTSGASTKRHQKKSSASAITILGIVMLALHLQLRSSIVSNLLIEGD